MITWPFDLTVYAGLLILFFGHAWLARGAADAEPKDTLFFLAGLATLWVALETPIDTLSDHYLDSVHMFQHVLLAFVAPPLLLLGLSPEMAARIARFPGLRPLTEPVPAQVVAAVVMIAWHVPALYDATLRNEELHIVEHLMFIGSGLVLYWPMLDATSAQSRWQMSPGARLVYMLLATLPQDGVALVLIFSRVPFYEYYTHVPRLIEGFTALIDQTIAGAVLMIFGKVTLAVAALVVFFRWFAAEQAEDRGQEVRPGPRGERSGDPGGLDSGEGPSSAASASVDS
ncbi:MAG TPA: cytochrome c oxidase assembly protein [Candidatus Limnocylindrales bacterium]|nr:cytochrome c oxidase assembly protein [Candidatus Limnocylindrales bacterium]